MIEKIPFETEIIPFKDKTFDVQTHASPYDLQIKINELVDAVNVLQAQVAILEEHAHPTAKTEPADPYAEQRKWIGKLCLFYDDNYRNIKHYGILTQIDECATMFKYEASLGGWYCACEPVKPDSNIIYKGE